MALWPDSVELAGASMPLDGILSDLTIHHGRETIGDDPTATTCQLTLLDVPRELVAAFEVGQSLALTVRDDEPAWADDFSANRLGSYTFYAGRGAPSQFDLVAGELHTLTSDVKTFGPTGIALADARVSVKTRVMAGTSYPGIFVRQNPADPLDFLLAELDTSPANGGPGTFWLFRTGLASADWEAFGGPIVIPGFTFGRNYWIVIAIVGRSLSAELWSSPPELGGDPLIRIDHVLTDAHAAAYAGARGVGFDLYPGSPDVDFYDDFRVTELAPRFTGHVTDATLTDDELTLIATGDVSRLRLYEIGAAVWPVESWSARVTRAFTEAGLADRLELHPDPQFDPQLAARDPATAGPTTLGDYLPFLAGMVGAAVTDRPDGRILVQAIGSRQLSASFALDPADVAYSPAWVAELPGGNIVTVRYTGDQSESVTLTDAASVDQYGERPETIDTAFVSVSDATYRANQRLGRAAFSHWNIPEAPILRGLLLEIGAPLILSEMPPASPADPWSPTVEGWTDQINGENWTMTLALSDPLLSGLTLPWSAVPIEPAYHWNAIDPATDWTEALTLDDLELN